MMFLVTLMCWDYRDTSLKTKVQTRHLATMPRTPSYIVSNDDLCIHPRAFDISAKDMM